MNTIGLLKPKTGTNLPKLKIRMSKWSKEKIKKELRRLSEKLGHSPSISECRKHFKGGDLVDACKRYFGSWNKAKKEAGLEIIHNVNKWNKEKVKRKIKELSEKLGHSPSQSEARREMGGSLVFTARKLFGTWNKAKKEVGLKVHSVTKWTKEKVLKELKKVAEKLGHSPTQTELREIGRYDLLYACRRHLGSLNNARKKLGLKIYYEPNKWNKSKVLEKLKEISKKLGHSPTIKELKDLGKYGLVRAAERYVGGFNKAKKELGLETYGEEYELPESAKKLSKELGYIIGVCLGDGSVSGNRISFDVSDKDFADYFAKQLEKWSGKSPSRSIYKPKQKKEILGRICNANKRYNVVLCSKQARSFIEKKIRKINWILDTPLWFQKQVFKGFFDSEGTILIRKESGDYRIKITNTDPELIDLMKKISEKIGFLNPRIKSRDTEEYKKRFNLILSGLYNVYILYKKIGVTIKRKKEEIDGLEEYVKDLIVKEKVYKMAKKLRKKEGIGHIKIHRRLKKAGFNIPKPTIGHWLYHGRKPKMIRYYKK